MGLIRLVNSSLKLSILPNILLSWVFSEILNFFQWFYSPNKSCVFLEILNLTIFKMSDYLVKDSTWLDQVDKSPTNKIIYWLTRQNLKKWLFIVFIQLKAIFYRLAGLTCLINYCTIFWSDLYSLQINITITLGKYKTLERRQLAC